MLLFSKLFSVTLLLFCFGATCAHAEKADKDKPTNIEANKMFYDDLKQLNVFDGNVLLVKGTMTIRAENLVVKQDPEGYQHSVALPKAGDLAYFRQKREGVDEWIEGWADRIEYDTRTEKIELFKRAFVKKECDEVTGDYIIYDGKIEQYTVVGGGKTVATANNPDGRVRAVIGPKGEPDLARPPVDPLVCRNKTKDQPVIPGALPLPPGVPPGAPPSAQPPLTLRATATIAAPREIPTAPPNTPTKEQTIAPRQMTPPATPVLPTAPPGTVPPPTAPAVPTAPTATPAAAVGTTATKK